MRVETFRAPKMGRLAQKLTLRIPKSTASPHHDRWSNSHDALALDVGARRCLKGLVGDFAEEIFVGLVEFIKHTGKRITRAPAIAQACRSRELALLVAHALPCVVAVLVSAASMASVGDAFESARVPVMTAPY
jgi:hypothetical protein